MSDVEWEFGVPGPVREVIAMFDDADALERAALDLQTRGLVAAVGLGSAVATLPILAAAGSGAAIGTALDDMMHRHHAERLWEQLGCGGIPLWMNVCNPD